MPTIIPPAISLLRNRPDTAAVRHYLAIAPYGDPCFTAQVNDPGNALVRGSMTIPYDNDTGAANVEVDMTLWVGSASKRYDYGTVRIKAIDAGASTITVAENTDIDWTDNWYLAVPGESGFYELWSKLPRIADGPTFYTDYDEAYVDQGDNLPPKSNAGAPVIAWLSEAGCVTVSFVGDDSDATEEGAVLDAFEWVFPGVPATEPTLANLVLKLDAGEIEGLADGDKVALWEDQSGNGNDLAQAADANKPLYYSTGMNGRPAVLFDGINDYLERNTPVMNGTDNFSIVVAMAPTGLATNVRTAIHIGQHGNNGYGVMGSGNTAGRVAGLFGGVDWLDTFTSFVDQIPTVIEMTRDAGTATLYQDGITLVPTWVSVPNVPTNNTRVGWNTTHNRFDGYIAEIWVFDAPLNASDRALLSDYLTAKYTGQNVDIGQGTRADPVTATWCDTGFHYVDYTVTDDNDEEATVHVPMWVFEEGVTDPYTDVEVLSQDGDTSGGWKVRVRCHQSNTAAEDIIYSFPDGALCVLFTRTWYDGTEYEIGGYLGPADTEQGTLAYAAASFQDDGQDFSDWATNAGFTAGFLIVVTNDDLTQAWGYCGPSSGAGDIDVAIYSDAGLTTAGWNGDWNGKTPESYEVWEANLTPPTLGRANIRMMGWLDGESVDFDFADGTIEFDISSHDGIMRKLPGFPFTLEDNPTPSDWYEMKDLNVDRAMHHLFEYYTTVNQVCHVERVGEGTDRPIAIQSYTDTSIYGQVQGDLLGDAQCLLLADRQGIVRATKNPQMLQKNAAGRDSIPVQGQLTSTDWMNEIAEIRGHRPNIGAVRAGGFAYKTPFLSQCPIATPGETAPVNLQEEREAQPDGWILVDQDELNWWCGLTLTQMNVDYPELPLVMAGYWPVFDPAYQEYIRLTLTDALSRTAWTKERFIPRSVSFRTRGDTDSVQIDVEHESEELQGETVTVPNEPTPPMPDIPVIPAPPPWGGDLKYVILMTDQGVFYTEDFDSLSPQWYASNSGLSTASRQGMRDIAFDFDHGSRLFMVGPLGVYSCADIWNGAGWSLSFDNDYPVPAIAALGTDWCAINDPNWLTYGGWWDCVSCDPLSGHLEFVAGANTAAFCGGHKRAFYSGDGLATVTVGDTLNHDEAPGVDHRGTTDWAWITTSGGISVYTYGCGWGIGGDTHRGYSTDGAIEVNTGGFPPGQPGQLIAGAVHHAFQARAGADLMYFFAGRTDVFLSGDNGSTWANLGAVLPRQIGDTKHGMAMHNLDHQNMMYVSDWADARASSDQGSTWSASLLGGMTCVVPAMVSYGAEGECFIAAGGDSVYLTLDFGTTWLDKSGNLGDWLDGGVDDIIQIIPVQEGQVE